MLPPYEFYFSQLFLSEPTSTGANESPSSPPVWVLIAAVTAWATALALALG